MSLPPRPASSSGPRSEGSSERSEGWLDLFLYVTAAATYIPLAIYNKWLLDWIVGPLWLVAWVWGLPAIVRLLRGQPVRPRRGPDRDQAS